MDSDTGVFVENLLSSGVEIDGVASFGQLDVWSQIIVEGSRVMSVAGTKDYVAYADSKLTIHFASLGGVEFVWDSIEEQAEQLAICQGGSVVWRLHNGIGFALVRPTSLGPKGQKWMEAAVGDVICISVTRSAAWYLKKSGKVCVQFGLHPEQPCGQEREVNSDWPLVSITSSEEAVWGLRDNGRLLVRVGMGPENPSGDDWVEIFPDGPSELVSVCLYGNSGWAVDVHGRLWFTTGVSFKHPFGRTGRWWQPVCLASTLGVLWVLDARGRIFLRSGIDPKRSPLGTKWETLDMTQLGPETMLCNLTCTLDAVWAVDTGGNIWVRLSTQCVLPGGLSSAWVLLDTPKGLRITVDGVHASSDGSLVWAVAKGGRVWARDGITQEMPIGSTWSEVEGLNCKRLAVGSEVVWALDSTGQLYRRHGVKAENHTGNYWKKLNSTLRFIAVSPMNRLWGLDEGKRLVKHQVKIYWPSRRNSQSGTVNEKLPMESPLESFELV